jgi:queuine tRNA-ribosyltransferase
MPFPGTLKLKGSELRLPQYLPDATLGQVRSLDAADTAACGIKALMMNTFHLMQKPGTSTVKSLGGLQQFSGWRKAIFTDSGGFQAWSLIRQNSKFGSLNDNGISFTPEGGQRKFLLTPEKCVQLQVSFGTDVVFCLDDCTHIDDPDEEQRLSVTRTIQWARRCRAEFDRLMEEKKLAPEEQPKIFGIVQGGSSPDLRRECAESLLESGFDGYGYGGWPLDEGGKLVEDMVALTRELIPAEFPLHALGIGHPPYIARCHAMGYGLFDSAMPTRDARHGRLYTFKKVPTDNEAAKSADWFGYVYADEKRNIKSSAPVEEGCDCPLCSRYSLGYLRHLFKINDTLYHRLATMHNLRFMTRLMAALGKES